MIFCHIFGVNTSATSLKAEEKGKEKKEGYLWKSGDRARGGEEFLPAKREGNAPKRKKKKEKMLQNGKRMRDY